MASIYKRKDSTNWMVSWVDNVGNRIIRSTGTRCRRQAEKFSRVIIQAHNVVEIVEPETLEKLSDTWLNELNILGRSKAHLVQRARAVQCLSLGVQTANKTMGEKSLQGQWSDQTIRLHYAALVQFGKWCVENGHRDRNPMLGLKRPSRRTGRVYVRGVLTKDQAQALCNHPAIPAHRRLVYRTALSTGLRLGELRKLKPEHLKIMNGRHCIHLKPRHVKNRFESVLPISEELYAELQDGLDLKQFSKQLGGYAKIYKQQDYHYEMLRIIQ